jgi:hypothetical protein
MLRDPQALGLLCHLSVCGKGYGCLQSWTNMAATILTVTSLVPLSAVTGMPTVRLCRYYSHHYTEHSDSTFDASTRIQEVFGSNLGRDIHYPDWHFVWYSSRRMSG